MSQTPNETRTLVENIPILHVYGSLGPLPIQNTAIHTPFGAKHDFISHSSQSLRTFMEGVTDGTRDSIRTLVDWADVIIILGFGYDRMNVDLLFQAELRPDQTVRGTSLGVSPLATEYFFSRAKPNVGTYHLAPTDCQNFLRDPYLPAVLELQ
jgi:hypothetical protein